MRPEHTCGGSDKNIGCGGCYETGYENGESSVSVDNSFWFHDVLDLPDDWSNGECKDFIKHIIDKTDAREFP